SLTHIDLGPRIPRAPSLLALNVGRVPARFADPFGTHQIIRVIGVSITDLPLAEESTDIIGEFIDDKHVIEDIALVRCLAAPDRDRFEWRLILERPGDFIDAVAGLLHKAIPAEPNEIVPIAQL